MKFKIFIFFVFLFCSCDGLKNKKVAEKREKDLIESEKTSIPKECYQRDTITKTGTRIKYLYRNGKFQIAWGNDSYNRKYDSLYSCDYDSSGLWDFVPKLNSETKNHLVFTNILWTSSGGNPAPLEYYAIVVPKNNQDSTFEKDFFITTQGDYLVYGDPYNEKIFLRNIETKKDQTILLNPKPAMSRSPTLAIQQVRIKNGTINIKYESLDELNDYEVKIVDSNYKVEI